MYISLREQQFASPHAPKFPAIVITTDLGCGELLNIHNLTFQFEQNVCSIEGN